MLKDAIGVPGLTLRYLFKTLPSDTFVSLVWEKHKDFHQLLREQMVGGPSIIFHRYHEKGITTLRGPEGRTVSCLEGYDANALYLWALMQEMPTGYPVRRRKERGFRAERVDKHGQMCREWLEWTMRDKGVSLRHKFNGKEQSLGKRRLRVDGWDAERWTAYQFHGCLFCDKNDRLTTNPVNGKSIKELREKTLEISRYLRWVVGVEVVEMWECQWDREKRDNPALRRFLLENCPKYVSPFRDLIGTEDVIRKVEEGRMFGMVQCNVEVPDHLRASFAEMIPVFKNAEVGLDDVGDYMKSYAEERGLLRRPRRTLVGSYFGKKDSPSNPFAPVVSAAWPRDTFKLLGNSAYGKTLTNITRHRDVFYLDDASTPSMVNDPRFVKLTPLGTDLTEVELSKKILRWNLPSQIDFFVYQNAKLRMLQFYYDCVARFVSKEDIQLCEIDTDSLYMALSEESLESAVRPDQRTRFYREYKDWFPSPVCDEHEDEFVRKKSHGRPWNPLLCCRRRAAFDKRTPGLFKLEYKGDGIVALCSKTYFCFGDDRTKASCKGLSRRLNDLTKDKYLKVLRTRVSGGGINKGFRTDGRAMYTYQQTRRSLSFFYIKRPVQADGVSTLPTNV
ncbi:hypothetical protein ACOMHN_058521 [Nucella lapillus]